MLEEFLITLDILKEQKLALINKIKNNSVNDIEKTTIINNIIDIDKKINEYNILIEQSNI